MADVDVPADLTAFDYDFRAPRFAPYNSRVSWPMPFGGEQNASRFAPQQRSANPTTMKRSTTPLQNQQYLQPISQQPQFQTQASQYIPDWQLPPQTNVQLGYSLDGSYQSNIGYSQQLPADSYAMPYQTSPIDYVSGQDQYSSNLSLEASYLPLTNPLDNTVPFEYQEFSNDLLACPITNGLSNGLPDMNLPLQNLSNSPTDTALEVRSLSSSDNGWASVDYQQQQQQQQNIDGTYQQSHVGAIFNPGETLHGRSFSDSSYSDVEKSRQSWGSSYVEIPQGAIGSPGSDPGDSSGLEFHSPNLSNPSTSPVIKQEEQTHRPMIVTPSTVKPLRIKTSSSPQRSPTSTGRISPPGRRQPKKNPNGKAAKPTIRRQSQVPKVETEKRVGRRKGPLKPEQRKQACEIRKLGACIRCKFLKKTVSISNSMLSSNIYAWVVRQRRTLRRLSTFPCTSMASSVYTDRHQGDCLFHERLEGRL